MKQANSRKANFITAALIASITILAACTEQQTPIEAKNTISVVEVAKVATIMGVVANNECLQLATLTLNGYNSSITGSEELANGRCYREVVKSWMDYK